MTTRLRRTARSVALLPMLCTAACGVAGARAQLGWMQMQLDGSLGLTVGGGRVDGLEAEEFGLGESRGSPFVRAGVELGDHSLHGSAFVFAEEGTGRLSSDFGGIGGDSLVRTDLEFTNAQLAYGYDLGFGPVTIAPGIGVDVFDLRFSASSVPATPTSTIVTESIDEIVVVPMLVLRAGVEVGIASVQGSVGWLETPSIDGNRGGFLDAELMAEVAVLPSVHLFAGYRFLDLDAEGETGSDGGIDAFEVDLQLRGWTVGGGVSF